MKNVVSKIICLIMIITSYMHIHAMEHKRYAVGTQLFDWKNKNSINPQTKKPRIVKTQIWYPAQADLANGTVENANPFFTYNFEKLPVKEIIKYPVIVFCHHNKINYDDYSAISTAIASKKFVVMTVMNNDGVESFLDDLKFMLNQAITGFHDTIVYSSNDLIIARAFDELWGYCNFNNIGIIFASADDIKTLPDFCKTDRFKAYAFLSGNNVEQDTDKPVLYCTKDQTTKDVFEFLEKNLK